MRFFLDENIPKKVGEYLVSQGYDFNDIRGTEKEGATDEEIFKLAQKSKAIFLTTDKDFFHTIPYLYPKHEGIVVIALSQPNTQNILEKVEYAVSYLEKRTLASRCLLMTDKNMHITVSKEVE